MTWLISLHQSCCHFVKILLFHQFWPLGKSPPHQWVMCSRLWSSTDIVLWQLEQLINTYNWLLLLWEVKCSNWLSLTIPTAAVLLLDGVWSGCAVKMVHHVKIEHYHITTGRAWIQEDAAPLWVGSALCVTPQQSAHAGAPCFLPSKWCSHNIFTM